MRAYLEAVAMGDDAMVQTAINAGFGELHAPGGTGIKEWQQIARRRQPHKFGEVPIEVIKLSAAVDVQTNGFFYSIRGWGARASSWQIESGELAGYTNEPEVWGDLANVLLDHYGGLPIALALIDSGFRPNKPNEGPTNVVYDFCRRFRRFVQTDQGLRHVVGAGHARHRPRSRSRAAKIRCRWSWSGSTPISGNRGCSNGCPGRRISPAASCSRQTPPTITASSSSARCASSRRPASRNGSGSAGAITSSIARR